jgi:chemotaxis protein MotA
MVYSCPPDICPVTEQILLYQVQVRNLPGAAMNKSVLVGSIGGVVLVAGVLLLSTGNMGAFFSIPGLIVVLGGTLVATLVSRPVNEVRELIESIPALFRSEESTMERDVEQLLKFARRYRVCDARAAERELASISNPFVATGLRQVVEGCGLEDLGKSLQWRIAGERSQENGQTQILYAMATFAPAVRHDYDCLRHYCVQPAVQTAGDQA